ncbi:hypothetical protein VHEMI01400 [[Torrubiella] hemipterigena]|uniref:Copper homeostasis protein cutC homolog n=1 Tax=[Torrubiella] hemipterigena TaxID=1531966 RepID=A0A0A1ST03_9HYPO|nr:hypothetical protein VHEMI01400 [[Torrubiella] hemipterigena]
MPLPLEVAVFSSQDALTAQSSGAHRIEFNAPGSYPDGGLTPPLDELRLLSPQLRIPARVMIRPRGPPADGSMDFIYSEAELELMREAVSEIKAAGVMDVARGDGFVFGVLKKHEDGGYVVDEEVCKALVDAAKPVPCVFHRAFDPIAEEDGAWASGLDALLRCGFEGLLTAGGTPGKFCENLERLEELAKHVDGKLQIVAGGGVRHHNVGEPLGVLGGYKKGSVWVHSAALRSSGDGVDEEELTKLLAQIQS